MIDLHTHTTESDGTLTPTELLRLAESEGLKALAITDHDTFAGYDAATGSITDFKIDLICGIEVSAKFLGRSVHILGYFMDGNPNESIRLWVQALQAQRHSRNARLVELLCASGLKVMRDEVYQRSGPLPGRPHFAALLVEKGYVRSIQAAFDHYLGETGSCYVPRDEPGFVECVQIIDANGGLSVLAHPLRLTREHDVLELAIKEMKSNGLRGLEVYYSEHSARDTRILRSLASQLGLVTTGGSDFHGAAKPHIRLGSGIDGALHVPLRVLRDLQRPALFKDIPTAPAS